MTKTNGEIVFHMEGVEVPDHWSQQATNILAQKYFRKAGVPNGTYNHNSEENPVDFDLPIWLRTSKPVVNSTFGPETSAKQVFHRLAGAWTYWGWKEGIFEGKLPDGYVPTNEDIKISEENAHIFYDEIYFMLAHQLAAPNSPQFFNTGLFWAYGIKGDANGQWANDKDGKVFETKNSYEYSQPHACFIQPISDNLIEDGGIFDLLKKEARLFKHGSGTGTNFSNLRGKGEKLAGGGISSGMMSFLKIFDTAAGAISSGGTTRRAAKMICLDLDHPEIESFIDWKMNEERKAASLYVGSEAINRYLGSGTFVDDLTPQSIIDRVENGFNTPPYDLGFEGEAINTVSGQNANNSIRITNEFLQAVDENKDWNLYNRKDRSLNKTIKASDLWDKICRAAWACGDPGLQFHDTINLWHTCKTDGKINASNPCSEYMFLDDTACNLASLNLGKFLKENKFQIKDFEYTIRLWTIVLEISVYMASFPSKEVAQNSYTYRTLGLGYANLGGILMRLGLGYDSDEGRNWAQNITALLHGVSLLTSQEMNKELGPFEKWENNEESMSEVINKHKSALLHLYTSNIECGKLAAANHKIWNQIDSNLGFRNAQTTLLAPTGTIALLMDCDTTGIEPDFSLIKYKNLSGGVIMKIVNECVPEALKNLGYTPAQIMSIVQHISEMGTIEGWKINGQEIPEEHIKVFDCANPSGNGVRYLRPMAHVLMMAAVQPFLSGAISKTCNLPNSATIQDVDFIYREAYRLGLKALAIYRDGSKLTQPLSSKKEPKPEDTISQAIKNPSLYPRPDPGQEPDYSDRAILEKMSEGETIQDSINIFGNIVNEIMNKSKPVHMKESKAHSPHVLNSSPKTLSNSSRTQLPMRRKGYTQKVRIDGQSIYLRTGEYPDGTLGEVWLEISREGSTARALLGGFSKLVSIALQFGVPLKQLVDAFVYTKFEPAGLVEGHDKIKITTSIFDFVFRELAIYYLNQTEFANVNENANGEAEDQEVYLDLDENKQIIPSVFIPPEEFKLTSEPTESTLDEWINKQDNEDVEIRAINRIKGEWLKATEISPPIFYPPESEESYEKVSEDYEKLKQKPKPINFTGNTCPNCGHNTLVQTGTCVTCTTCYSNTGCG
jgi:ribonucleoside-diphosphate reductase alpha chain